MKNDEMNAGAWLLSLADFLEDARRVGENVGPEGGSYIQMSDELARKISHSLRNIAAEVMVAQSVARGRFEVDA